MSERAATQAAISRARRLATGLSLAVVAIGLVWQGSAWVLRARTAQTQDSFFDVDVWVQTNSSAAVEALHGTYDINEWLAGRAEVEQVQRHLGSAARQLRVGQKSVPHVLEPAWGRLDAAVGAARNALPESGLSADIDTDRLRPTVDELADAAVDFHIAGRAVMVDELRGNVDEQRSIAEIQWVFGILLSTAIALVLILLRRTTKRERMLFGEREDERRRVQEQQRRHASVLELIASGAPTEQIHAQICRFATESTGRTYRIVDGGVVGDWMEQTQLGELCDGLLDTVTARDLTDATIKAQAMTDSLTGLVNRKAFVDRLDSEIARWQRRMTPNAVLLVDLNRFKAVNDLLGHSAGDELLTRVAGMLRAATRESDVIARLGGDEFVCLLTDCDREGAEVVARRIAAQIDGPVDLAAGAADVSMSVGLVDFAEVRSLGFDVTADELLHAADLAMYHAKRERIDMAWFVAEIANEAKRRQVTAGELRTGLAQGEIVCHYQPVLNMATGQIVGVEALARWQHGDELRFPGHFISVAEEHGLIAELGDAVLRQACRQLAEWQALGIDLSMAVNVSGLQLRRPDFVADVATALEETGVAGEGLVLEVTESVLLSDKALAKETLSALRQLGIEVAIDDFGTGYSSLASLQDLPIDILKIDRSFVSRLGDQRAGEIVSAIIALAGALQLRTIAEGIETEDQSAVLTDLGCDEAQGFLFARPTAPADLTPTLLDSTASVSAITVS